MVQDGVGCLFKNIIISTNMRSPIFRPKPKGTRLAHSIKIFELNRIKQMIEDKYTLYTIAEKYGVSYETVSRIKRTLNP